MLQIPLQALPAQRLRVLLDDQECTLTIYWRFGALYMDMQVGTDVVFTGAICQAGASVVTSPTVLFSGSLHFFDTQGAEAPQWEGLGSRWVLLFIPAGESIPAKLRF